MKLGLILSMLVAMQCLAQTTQTGQAETAGPCSPAVTGNNNQFSIKCEGISTKQGEEFLRILNKIVKNQLDPDTVMEKLGEIDYVKNFLTGGDSFCLLHLSWSLTGKPSDILYLSPVSVGKYPLHGVTVQVIDLERTQSNTLKQDLDNPPKDIQSAMAQAGFYNFRIGDMPANVKFDERFSVRVGTNDIHRFHATFWTDSGNIWFEDAVFRVIKGQWVYAARVTGYVGGPSKPQQFCDKEYPGCPDHVDLTR